MRLVQVIYPLLVALLIGLAATAPVFAQGITIDGTFTDWAGKTAVVDTGGADDERSPARADITEFRADAASDGLYLLKAWDDTSFTGGQATTAGITMQAADGTYYRIYSTAQGNPGNVPLGSLDIKSCGTDSTCKTQTAVCAGTGCSGALAGSGTSWTDPFSGRASPDCSGTSCGTQDTAVEFYIPWNLIGGAPSNGQVLFLYFGSYPSGPAQAPKDDSGNGIACRNTEGTFQCYVINPTAVTLSSFRARADAAPAMGFIVPLLALAGVGALVMFARTRGAR